MLYSSWFFHELLCWPEYDLFNNDGSNLIVKFHKMDSQIDYMHIYLCFK
jgi:hypothetical protein